MFVTMFSGQTAQVAPPSGNSAGAALWKGGRRGTAATANDGLTRDIDECQLIFYNTAGTGAMAVSYLRLWAGILLDDGATILWVPAGTGVDADKGKLNNGLSVGTVAANQMYHTERIRGFRDWNRVALETGTLTGTPTMKAQLLSAGAFA